MEAIKQTIHIQIILLFFMNNIYIKKNMNHQDNQVGSLFKPFDLSYFQKLQKEQFINQLEVSLKKSINPTHWLFMTKKYLFLSQKESLEKLKQVYAVELDFQIKFQAVLTPNSTLLDKIGIRFVKDKKQCVFYTFDQYNLDLFLVTLPQYINQMSFHEVYSPLEKLGRGHFAHVYHVARISDGQQFAVKAFSKEKIYSVSTGKQSLKNEIKIMRETSNISKNLLKLYEVYQTEKSIYVVLQLLRGQNLRLVMQSRPAGLKYHEVKVLLQGLLTGIKCLHDKKIMHRDLKPENIVFRTEKLLESAANFDPVIVDFGMATHYDIQPYIFYRCGTAGYIAPQVTNLMVESAYSPVCDIFSIGCLFHLMMTGNQIFNSTQDDQLLEQNKNLQFDIYTERVENCHPFAMDLLQRLVQKSPSKRISIQQALTHNFFNEKHLQSPQFLARKKSIFNFFGLFSD